MINGLIFVSDHRADANHVGVVALSRRLLFCLGRETHIYYTQFINIKTSNL